VRGPPFVERIDLAGAHDELNSNAPDFHIGATYTTSLTEAILRLTQVAMIELLAAPLFDAQALAAIVCGNQGGSGFWIAPERVITAAHVVREGACRVNGQVAHLVRVDRERDIAELRTAPSTSSIPVDCGRPRTGRIHVAMGRAYGSYWHWGRFVPTRSHRNGLRVMYGTAHEGMSGAPVINLDGKAVAIVNRGGGHISMSSGRDLAETFVCED
jgi:hypothetical protein